MTRSEQLTAFLMRPAPAFDWRSANCGHYVCDWVQFATGRDYSDAMVQRGSWLGAHRAVLRQGGIAEILSGLFGEPIPASMACDGDIALIQTGGRGFALGIFSGRHVVSRDAGNGYTFLPRGDAVAAWEIGE